MTNEKRFAFPSLVLLAALLPACAQGPAAAPSASGGNGPQALSVGSISPLHQVGDLYLAGQPNPADLKLLAQERGVKTVLSLRRPSEINWDEAARAKEAGLSFVNLPFAGGDDINDETFDKVRALLNDDTVGPVLLHCGSANRVGGVWLPHRVLDEGVPLDQAIAEAKQIGLKNPVLEAKAKAYIEKKKASP